jgi:hypothetical protein
MAVPINRLRDAAMALPTVALRQPEQPGDEDGHHASKSDFDGMNDVSADRFLHHLHSFVRFLGQYALTLNNGNWHSGIKSAKS